MEIHDLETLLKETSLSAEGLGELIGVSGMTIRRWIDNPSDETLPALYQVATREAIFKMIINGRLDSDSKSAKWVFDHSVNLSQHAALKAMGFPTEIESGDFSNYQDKIMVGLSQIGSLESRRKKVDSEKKRLPSYKKLGLEWKERISVLTGVIGSPKLSALDKFPAYGALFYLFMTFDLIPDTIPVFGLVDDFAILGIAVAYYLRRNTPSPA